MEGEKPTLIQNLYWFRLKAVLCFQKVIRINTGTPLSNTGNYLRYSRELSQKISEQIKNISPSKRGKFNNNQAQAKFTGSYKKVSVYPKIGKV